jgi:hypothetical protein
MNICILACLLAAVGPAPFTFGAEYYVSPSGSNANSGRSPSTAWRTLQHAADVVGPGDRVHVLPGTYAGFNVSTSGSAAAPIAFLAEGGELGPNPAVVIDTNNTFTNRDRINLEGASHVVIQGFTVLGSGNPATNRACIRTVGSAGDPARFVTVRNNRCDRGGTWGIFTGFVDDLLIEGNETSRAADEHGIYVSNSGDRPVIRRNHTWGNHANGIHMNGDASLGGDGIISGALVEQNTIHGNGVGGGSGINCDGVQDSVFQNNLLYDNHASGVSLYRIDGGGPSKDNVVVNNTIWNAANGRWALNIQNGATGNRVLNNVLLNDHPSRGAIDISSSSLPGLVSDYNVVKDRFGVGGVYFGLAQWQAQTGQDVHSAVSTPQATFANAATFDLQLKPGSPALNAGTATSAPPVDLLGRPRPAGPAFDIGAYEHGSCRGSAAAYGTALPGSGGIAPQIALSGCPEPGEALSLSISSSVAGAQGLLVAGPQPAQIALFGGTLWVQPVLGVPRVGSGVLPLAVPASPALVGATVHFQALFLDELAPAGVAMSDGLAVTVR